MGRATGSRQRLISTATALLAEEGVEAVTLRRIARATGVSHGAPLRHFAGRAQLLSAVAATGFLALQDFGRTEEAPRERLHAACRGYVDFALANPALFELMFRHDLIDARDPELAAATTALFDRFTGLVRAAQAENWRSGSDPALLAGSLWAALYGLADLWLHNGLPETTEHVEPALAVTLEAFLG